MTVDPAKLRSLLEAATPRPWTIDDENDSNGRRRIFYINGPAETVDYGCGPERLVERVVETDGGHYGPKPNDADLIVSAVNALGPLLDVFEAACAWRACAGSDADLNGACARHDRHLIATIDRARGGK